MLVGKPQETVVFATSTIEKLNDGHAQGQNTGDNALRYNNRGRFFSELINNVRLRNVVFRCGGENLREPLGYFEDMRFEVYQGR